MFKIVNFRIGKLISNSIVKNGGCLAALPLSSSPSYTQHRSMTSKRFRVKKEKPAPYPYREKEYGMHTYWDQTYTRFDENTKLIIVEGPIASGKHELAKYLADQFECLYVPDITTDFYYINDYGYDMRNLDPKLPESCRSFDEKDFCRNPTHFNAAPFQVIKYYLRWIHYWDMINHILNTGQGVVTVRSPFSNSIFSEPMKECGYISEPGSNYLYVSNAHRLRPPTVNGLWTGKSGKTRYTINTIVRETIFYLFRPHLVIYLDVPVDITLKNIKERNREEEVKGPALTEKYLQLMEDNYKKRYLHEASVHSMLLQYNWSEKGDPEVVVEDIERINFQDYELEPEAESLKLADWRMEEINMNWERYKFSAERLEHRNAFDCIQIYDAPEMWISGNDQEVRDKVWYSAPGMRYCPGFNIDRGDKVLFKSDYMASFSTFR